MAYTHPSISERALIIVGTLILAFMLANATQQKSVKAQEQINLSCVYKEETRFVRGSSLAPLITEGQSVKILHGYYECNPVSREDIVVYDYAGNSNPIIKIAKGIPGDRFSLSQAGAAEWNILINGEVLKNSECKPYLIDSSGYRMLSLYITDYRGVVPKDAHLVMGNQPFGSLDSTRFGLVDKSDIIGKAVPS